MTRRTLALLAVKVCVDCKRSFYGWWPRCKDCHVVREAERAASDARHAGENLNFGAAYLERLTRHLPPEDAQGIAERRSREGGSPPSPSDESGAERPGTLPRS
jgi:hypothetical protein